MVRATLLRKLSGLCSRKGIKNLLDLSSGISPETLALSIAFGFALGLFPILGCPTLLCVFAAVALKLNAPAVQLMNYLVYPLQLALIAPFTQIGRQLLPWRHAVAMPRLSAILHGGFSHAMSALAGAAGHAVAGWFCVCAPAGALLYLLLAGYLRSRAREAGR